MRAIESEGQLAKVLVVCDDDALFRLRTSQDCVIGFGAHRLLHREHVMPPLPQFLNHRPGDVLVDEEAHGSILHVGSR